MIVFLTQSSGSLRWLTLWRERHRNREQQRNREQHRNREGEAEGALAGENCIARSTETEAGARLDKRSAGVRVDINTFIIVVINAFTYRID